MPGQVKISTETKNRMSVNLVSKIDEDFLKKISLEIISDYQTDLDSFQGWRDQRDRWYKLYTLDVGQNWNERTTGKNDPWPNASNVCIPMLATAVNQFHGRSYQSIFAAPELVKALPAAKNDVKRSRNVQDYMNWQLRHEMDEYEEVMDKLLLNLPINGTAFKKIQWLSDEKRPLTSYVGAVDLVVPYRTTREQFRTGNTRIVHKIYLNWDEILDRQQRKIYENVDKINEAAGKELDEDKLRQTVDGATGESPTTSMDDPHLILECHKNYDLKLEGEGRKPYIITVHRNSGTIQRITSRELIVGSKTQTLNFFIDYHFIPNTEGFYSFGFGHFLETLNLMGNTAFNQIFDAGSIANQPFGFFGRRAGFKEKNIKLTPGKMIEVEDATQVAFPAMQRLDSTLFQVLGLINTYVSSFTSVSENILGREQQGVERPTARGTLALIEQGLMTFSVIVKRVYRSMKQEFRVIKWLNEIFLPDEKEFRISGSSDKIAFSDIKKEDFMGVNDIIPIADPSFASRQVRRQEAFQLHEITMNNPLVIGTPSPKEGGEPAIKPNLQAMFESTRNLYAAFDEPRTQELIEAIERTLPPVPPAPDEENSMFQQGDISIPSQQDDHIAHLQSHTDFIATDMFKSMPGAYQDSLREHITLTQQVIAAQLQQPQPAQGALQ